MTDTAMTTLASEARDAAQEAQCAAADLEAEGRRINEALKRADALAAYIVEHAQAEELSTHVEISFEPHHAAMIANMAEVYRTARAGERPTDAQT